MIMTYSILTISSAIALIISAIVTIQFMHAAVEVAVRLPVAIIVITVNAIVRDAQTNAGKCSILRYIRVKLVIAQFLCRYPSAMPAHAYSNHYLAPSYYLQNGMVPGLPPPPSGYRGEPRSYSVMPRDYPADYRRSEYERRTQTWGVSPDSCIYYIYALYRLVLRMAVLSVCVGRC